MRHWLVGLFVLVCPSAFAQQPVPEIPFESVPDVLRLPPDLHLGEVTGVAVNSRKNIIVYSRGGPSMGHAFRGTASQLLEFDSAGNFLREIGKNLYAWSFGHVVRVDSEDNIWAVDKGSDMVVKFNPAGRVTMLLGRKPEPISAGAIPHKRNPPPKHDDGRFREPSDVTWDRAGNIYISDGYVNSRVAKFTRNGDWVKSWGERGKGPGQFDLLHTIAADAQGNIYVGDRSNRRIQVFDGEGTQLREIRIDVPFDPNTQPAIGSRPANPFEAGSQGPGAPWAICITPGPRQVMYVSDSYPGRIYKVGLDGTVLGWLGRSGKQLKQFGWIHEIACPSENEIYIAEILNWRVQKLLLRP